MKSLIKLTIAVAALYICVKVFFDNITVSDFVLSVVFLAIVFAVLAAIHEVCRR